MMLSDRDIKNILDLNLLNWYIGRFFEWAGLRDPPANTEDEQKTLDKLFEHKVFLTTSTAIAELNNTTA